MKAPLNLLTLVIALVMTLSILTACDRGTDAAAALQDPPVAPSTTPAPGDIPATPGEDAAAIVELQPDPAAEEAELAAREAELQRREEELARTRRAEELERREAELRRREARLAEEERRAARATPPPAPAPRVETPVPAPPAPEPEVAELDEPEPVVEEAEPEPTRRRNLVAVTIPAGTGLEVEFLDTVGSALSSTGEEFRTRLTHDLTVDGMVAVPAGAEVLGSVVEAVPLGKVGGRAQLTLRFDRLRLPSGETMQIDASFAEAGKNETRRDAATIGGGAAAGAVLGRILAGRKDRGKGTVIGAIIGAAAGTAIASKTEGEEVEIPAGTAVKLTLDEWVRVLAER